jgi:hypothetical protein
MLQGSTQNGTSKEIGRAKAAFRLLTMAQGEFAGLF